MSTNENGINFLITSQFEENLTGLIETNNIHFNDQMNKTLKNNYMRSIGYDMKNSSIFWINNENDENI